MNTDFWGPDDPPAAPDVWHVVAVTHKPGLLVGARSFTGNPYDGHTLAEQLEQIGILIEDVARGPKQVIVDLRYRGVDADNPGVEIIHRGKFKSLIPFLRNL